MLLNFLGVYIAEYRSLLGRVRNIDRYYLVENNGRGNKKQGESERKRENVKYINVIKYKKCNKIKMAKRIRTSK
jgi:hypothetical protein